MKPTLVPTSEPASPSPTATELQQTVELAQAGDLEAQSELVRRYGRRLAGLVRGIVRDRSAIEDIVQIVCIKMVRRLPGLRDPQLFERWLFALARNTALDSLRQRRAQPDTVSDDLEWLHAPDSSHAVGDILAALDNALAQLSPKDRQVVSLIVEGHSYQAVAQQEGLTIGAVKVRLHRARPLLRCIVSEAIGTPSRKLAATRARLAA